MGTSSQLPARVSPRQDRSTVNMPHRASSPAVSENEFDITNALFQDVASDEEEKVVLGSKSLGSFDAAGILDLDSDDGDEAFIAAQQAASNRKTTNAKGKTGKKGGGFQTMGEFQFISTSYNTNLARSERLSAQRNYSKRFHGSYTHPTEDDTARAGRTRCGRNGKDWIWKNSSIRYTHD